MADCGRARALNPSYHRVLRRMSRIYEELGRPGHAVECLQDLKALCSDNATDVAALDRSIMQLNANKLLLGGSPNHSRMLNVDTNAPVCNYLLPIACLSWPVFSTHSNLRC